MKRFEISAVILAVVFVSTGSGLDCNPFKDDKSYLRKPGRIPDKSPCPEGLRDDGTSCWSDAHIYGKGCCCTLFSLYCCNNCKTGYHDDGCTCRKTDVGIKVTLGQRWRCNADEELVGALCIEKCKAGFKAYDALWCKPPECFG